MAHIFDRDVRHWLHVVATNSHDETVDSFVLTTDNSLREHNGVVSMAGAVGDPVLLTGGSRRVDDELVSVHVEDRCGLHLGGIVTVTKLSKTEAAMIGQRVDLAHERQVAVRVQRHQGTTE